MQALAFEFAEPSITISSSRARAILEYDAAYAVSTARGKHGYGGVGSFLSWGARLTQRVLLANSMPTETRALSTWSPLNCIALLQLMF